MTERTLTIEEKRAAAEAKRRRAAARARRIEADAAAKRRAQRSERAAAKPAKKTTSTSSGAKKSTATASAAKKSTAKAKPRSKTATKPSTTTSRKSGGSTARSTTAAPSRSRSTQTKSGQTRRPATTTAKSAGAPKRPKNHRPVTKAARPAAKALDSISAIEPIVEVGDARRRVTAAEAIGGVFVAYLVAALLGSGGLVGLAERQPIGTGRTVAMGAAAATDRVANLFSLNRPADSLAAALADSAPTPTTVPVKVATAVTRPEEAPALVPTRQDSPLPVITPARPLEMWVGGDSMVRELSNALVGEVPFDTVPLWDDNFRVSSGLSRPDFHDWPAQIAADMIAEEPDAVVIMFGANDFQDFEVAGGAILSRGTPEWLAEYQRRVGNVMDILDQPGTRVTWVGQPVMRSDQLSQGMAQMNTIYAEEALLRERITFLNTWDLFTDGSGAYSLYLADVDGDEKRMRQEDGIHLSIAGAERMARAVWVEVANDWTFAD